MTPENPLLSGAGMLCLALGAAVLGGERERRLAAAGLLILGVAFAAWRAGSSPDAGLTAPGRLGRGFVVGNGGLLLLGILLVCGAALRAPPGPLRPAARVLTAGGVVPLVPVVAAFVGAAGPVRASGAALGLGLAGVAAAVGARAIAASGAVRNAARRLAPPPLAPVLQPWAGATLSMILVVALAATALGPHVAVVFLGLTVATWAGYLAFHPSGARPVPVSPVLTLLLLPAYWLLATVTGPLGLRIAVLPQVPLSPAAELLVSPTLLVAGWAAAGLWPLQRQLPGALLAPAAALLLARVALPLVPDGLEYWQPLTVPLVVLGLWNATVYARWPLLLAGAGFLGIAGAAPDATGSSAGLLAAGAGLQLCSAAAMPPRLTMLLRTVAWPLVTWAGVRVLEGVLRGEVVYTALGTLALALIVAAGRAGSLGNASRAR